jgi:hypothetical protein
LLAKGKKFRVGWMGGSLTLQHSQIHPQLPHASLYQSMTDGEIVNPKADAVEHAADRAGLRACDE